MTTKLGRFLSQDLKIESNVITENLDTISRFNLFSRVVHRNELDSVKICENIERALKGNKLNAEQERYAKINLKNMQIKFAKSSSKGDKCTQIINQILNSLTPQSVHVETRKISPGATVATPPPPITPLAAAPVEQKEPAHVKILKGNSQYTAIEALRNATGTDTRSVQELHSVQKSMIANRARMEQIAKQSGVTEADIRSCPDFGHFIQSNGEWRSVTIRKEIQGGIPHLQRVLVKAEVVTSAIHEIRRTGKRYDDSMFLQHARALGLIK